MNDHQKQVMGRRKSERFERSGNVSIRHEISGPNLNGSLVDLSTGGCRIRLADASPYDSTELVEVRLQSSTQMIRMMGWIRHVSDQGRTLGMEFHRLGAKESGFLADLIEDLKSASLAIH